MLQTVRSKRKSSLIIELRKKCIFFTLIRVDREERRVDLAKINATESNGAQDESNNNSINNNEDREIYIFAYTSIIVLGTICYACHSFCFFHLCLRISVNLHNMLYQGIIRAKMVFFNNNPTGRILNRFSRDIENVDSSLPHTLSDVLDVSSVCSSEFQKYRVIQLDLF